MTMQRVWTMPSANTFDIPEFRAIVKHHLANAEVSIDPFARNKRWATFTNDLNPDTAAEYHLDALDFLRVLKQKNISADVVIFDPPYSLEQCKRVYQSVHRKVSQRDTQVWGRWTEHKQLITELTRPNGVAISFGWNSIGMGIGLGFELEEIILACHGAGHNDTICTVERKRSSRQGLLFDLA